MRALPIAVASALCFLSAAASAQNLGQTERCGLPAASPAAKVVVLSTQGGDAASSVALGSKELGTRTSSVAVEDGEDPIYLVLLSVEANVWRISGATARIERVVLDSRSVMARSGREVAREGVTGVAAAKIHFAPAWCLPTFDAVPSVNSAASLGKIRREASPGAVVEAFSSPAGKLVSEFSIPSGRTVLRGRSSGRRMTVVAGRNYAMEGDRVVALPMSAEATEEFPGGYVDIDPAAVVASVRVERYVTPPGSLGIKYLLDSGAISRGKGGSGSFLIHRKVELPSESSVGRKFLLLRGVEKPDSVPGWTCVISEESGELVGGRWTNCF